MSDWTSPDGSRPPGAAPPPPPGPPPSAMPPPGGAPPPAMPPPGSAPPPGRPPGTGWAGGRRIPLRPMRYGEILDASFKLFRLTFTQVTVLVIVTLGLFTLLQVLVQPPQPGLLADPAEFDAFTGRDVVGLVVAGAIALFTQLFVLPLVRGAATGIAVEADRGGDTSWQAGLRTAWQLAGRLIGLSFLLLGLGIALLLVAALLGVGPVVLFVQLDVVGAAVVWGLLTVLVLAVAFLAFTALVYLAVPILLVEQLGAWGAVVRSVELVRPQLLRVVGLVFVTALLVGLVGGVLGIVTVPFTLIGGRVAQVGTAVVSLLAQVVTVPFQANVALLLYVDARVRAEGLDVAVLTAELDQL